MEESTIDLIELARALWKNILLIALAAILVGSAAFGYTAFLVTPTYNATVSLYVNSSNFSLGATNFSVSEAIGSSKLVDVYLYILKSRTTMEDVIDQAGLSYTPERLKGMVSSKSVANTAAFEVTVTSTNPAEAELIANTIAKVLPDRITEIIDGSSVRIVDYAIIPARRSGPNVSKNTSMGILAGAALGAALVTLQFLMTNNSDTMLRSADDLRDMYPDLQVLSMIPDMRVSDKKGYYSNYSSYYGQANKKGGRKNNGK